MNFLLDTNVVSEWVKPRPDRGVVAWLADADEDRVFVSAVTLAECATALSACRRELGASGWMNGCALSCHCVSKAASCRLTTLLPNRWGTVVARSEAAGRPIGVMDAFIAATVEAHGMTLVTRNT